MIVNLFAGGAAGWELALLALGVTLPMVGIEWDAAACATRAALGLRTIRADVSAYPTEPFAGRVIGITASPPCQDFSRAGKRKGLASVRGQLVHEVLRWTEALRPRWLACEQVPDVLPIWRLERQERDVSEPAPVVTAKSAGQWMLRTGNNTTKGNGQVERYERDPDRPAPTVEGSSARKWRLRHPGRTYGTTTTTTTTEPAPTLAFGHNAAEWCWERPATTVMGDPRVFPPGRHHPENGDPSWSTRAIRVELWELAVLQGFSPDHPFCGNEGQKAQQIGDAIPFQLARALLGVLVET